MAKYTFRFSSSSLFAGWYDRERDVITIILHPEMTPSKLIATLNHEHIHRTIFKQDPETFGLLQAWRRALEERYGEDVFLGGHNPLYGLHDPEELMITAFLRMANRRQ